MSHNPGSLVGRYDSGNDGNGYTAAAGNHRAPFAHVSGGDLLDLTDPLHPTVKYDGVYTLTATLSPDSAPTNDAFMNVVLNSSAAQTQAYSPRLKATTGDQPISVTATAFIPAGGGIGVNLTNNDGADATWYLNATVSKVA